VRVGDQLEAATGWSRTKVQNSIQKIKFHTRGPDMALFYKTFTGILGNQIVKNGMLFSHVKTRYPHMWRYHSDHFVFLTTFMFVGV